MGGLVTVDGLLEPRKRFHMLLPVPGVSLSMLQVADLALATNLIGFFLLRRWLGAVAWAGHLGGTVAGLGFACGAQWRGDTRFSEPLALHSELCAADWLHTADSMDAGLARLANIFWGPRG